MPVVESWLVDAIDGYAAGGRWYVGRPLLVTENDYGLQLYNGDAGVVVEAGAGPRRRSPVPGVRSGRCSSAGASPWASARRAWARWRRCTP